MSNQRCRQWQPLSVNSEPGVGGAYLEGVFDAVPWLADADGLQHACVPELPEHQAVVEAQRKLREQSINQPINPNEFIGWFLHKQQYKVLNTKIRIDIWGDIQEVDLNNVIPLSLFQPTLMCCLHCSVHSYKTTLLYTGKVGAHLLSIGANTLDKVWLRLAQGLHQFIQGCLHTEPKNTLSSKMI